MEGERKCDHRQNRCRRLNVSLHIVKMSWRLWTKCSGCHVTSSFSSSYLRNVDIWTHLLFWQFSREHRNASVGEVTVIWMKIQIIWSFPLGGKILLLSHEINKSSIYLLALSGAVSSLLSPVKFYSYIQRFSPKLSDVFAFQHNVRLDERQHCLSYCSIFVIYLTSLRSTKTFMTARGIMRLCGVMDF